MLRDYSTNLSMGLCLGLLSLAGVTLPSSAQNMSFPEDLPANNSKFTASSQYMVYVPSSNADTLQKVRAIAPDAFKGKLSSGQVVVQIGRFNNLNFAQKRVEQLKLAGLPAEVATVSPKASTFTTFVPSMTAPVSPSKNNLASPSFATTTTPPITKVTTITTTGITVPPSQSGFNALPGVPGAADFNQQTIEISRQGDSAFNNAPPTLTTQPTAPGVPINSTLPQQNNNLAVAVPPSSNPIQASRYFVIIPSSFDAVLQKARTIVPTAKLNTSMRGTFIEVQAYPDRSSAETLSSTLRSQGLDSRVVYF